MFFLLFLAVAVLAGVILSVRLRPAWLWGQEGCMVQRSRVFRRRGGLPTIIAHRGGAGEAPEGSRVAAAAAVLGGADCVHLSCCLTRDTEVVCLHESFEPGAERTLHRLTGAARPVHHLDLKELPRLKAQLLPPSASRQEGCHAEDVVETAPWGELGLRIATLTEMLELLPRGTALVIEPCAHRTAGADLIKAIRKILAKYGRTRGGDATTNTDNVEAAAFYVGVLPPRCDAGGAGEQQASPVEGTVLSARSMRRLYCAHLLGLLPFVSLRWACGVDSAAGAILMVTLLAQDLEDNRRCKAGAPPPPSVSRWYWRLVAGLQSQVRHRALWLPSLFNHLRARGVPTVLAGVNDVESWKMACSPRSGICSVVTDYPARMHQWRLRVWTEERKRRMGREATAAR